MWFPSSILAAVVLAASISASASSVRAGAFMTPEGQGQLIAGVGYIAASRTFDRTGKAVVAPSFRKAASSAYVEYGLTNWLTIVAAPTVTTMRAGSVTNAYTGSDASAFGVRLLLFGDATRAIAVQALIQPPVGPRRDAMTEAAFGGPNVLATDLRFQFGQSFVWGAYPAFVDLEPGARLRGGGWPNEARFDTAFGLRPMPRDLILLQSFMSLAPSGGPRQQGGAPSLSSAGYVKLQLSLVHEVSRAWSVQIGGVRTILGRNAAREFGPLAALWYRF